MKNLRGTIPLANLFCEVCRIGRTDGVTVKKCYGCQVTLYCSPQCERKHWPDHRKFCRQTEEQAIREIVKTFVADSYISYTLKQLLVEESSFGSDTLANNVRAFARETHVVLLHMTFEPAEFSGALSSWALGNKWSYKNVKGMLQINGITSKRRYYIDQPDDQHVMEDTWAAYRKDADKHGHYSDPVVFAAFRDVSRNGCGYSHPFLTDSQVLKRVHKRVRDMQPGGLDSSIKKHLSGLNNYIHDGAARRLSLSIDLRKSDKNLILRALTKFPTGLETDPILEDDYRLIYVKIFSGDWMPQVEKTEENMAAVDSVMRDEALTTREKVEVIYRMFRQER